MSKKHHLTEFDQEIKRFNTMYGLPTLDTPGMPYVGDANQTAREKLVARLRNFKDILREELDEVDEIIAKIEVGDAPDEVLTDLADWLGDIQVYCASEMRKFGLDNSVILGVIMASNFSKLGKDGKPIFDDRGKVMKGPDYWRPEPMIRKYIVAAARQASRGN
jgi:predicted HAD superfamily Cof-like phosphohydrolase